ncbi:MAG: tetratricopeptide repeat-containing sulfotransferase family protein [Halioglobus sp.]
MSSTTGFAKSADIQKMMAAGDFTGALRAIDTRLQADNNDPESLYMAAVCYRHTGKLEEAQRCLDAVMEIAEDVGRIYQEQGYLHLARNTSEKALAAFANATQLNPALIASWRQQLKILQLTGRPREAQQAAAQIERLQKLPKALVAVTDLLAQGKLAKAESFCRKFLQANPTHTEAMRLLAEIAVRFGEMEDAQYLLQSAAEFEPDNIQVQVDLIGVLRKRQQFTEALTTAAKLYETQPDNPQLQSLYAIEKMQMGDYAGAIRLFDSVLQKLPGDAVTLTSKGHALKTCGDHKGAVDCYRAAIASNAWHGDAYYSLSNLKTYRFDEHQISEMLALQAREELSPPSRMHLDFALGKAFEDSGDYARAFGFYERGNRMKKRQSSYDPDRMSEELRTQRSFFSADFLANRMPAGCTARDPVFIVGLPRAGSTLLEQILSSHSQVDGTLELPHIPAMVQSLRRRGRDEEKSYPEILDDLTGDQLEALGQQYINETRIHRQGAPMFIDKMPNNFRHIGLIKLILPNAKIIDARRHPMACCFSGFKQLFAEGQEFSYDLVDIGRYYNDYVQLMDHWDAVAPGSVLRVHYEKVVQDLEAQVKRILDFCDLPFETACLDFYKTDRAVRTASSEQVRQPIYAGGLQQWQNFRPYLADLEASLRAAMEKFDAESAQDLDA